MKTNIGELVLSSNTSKVNLDKLKGKDKLEMVPTKVRLYLIIV